MKIPAILQGEARTRFLQGIAFGAVATIAIGFIWGGWVTGGTARTMTATAEPKSWPVCGQPTYQTDNW